ncbi:LOW QUALITY PROTEIN: uncharacterized protein gjz1 [Seriola aureovittata]|uniref:LOW QUALITY PROTEIN: uncharacterized protein gjz1 n=1 Tax=Seriola aureovittata TaxID=2871759 RepID=UPI0024BD7041|nr:LOW QUALITY PROTEIN: uncharacterized protein gjz1 [Seriola aureovittata]
MGSERGGPLVGCNSYRGPRRQSQKCSVFSFVPTSPLLDSQKKPGVTKAVVVTGFIPILRTAVDATTTCKCCSLWFGFLWICVVILFLAELPVTKLDPDFTCNGTRGNICTRACFNKIFHKAMMVAWNWIFVLVIFSVLRIDLHGDRGTVGFYLLITLHILVESWFVYVPFSWNLNNSPYKCLTDICSELRVCVVRATPEKYMSIYALASILGMIIVCSNLFCMYTIVRYLNIDKIF